MENNNLEEKINKKSEKFSDKLNNFFDNIEFVKLSPESKEEVALKVKNKMEPSMFYRIQLFLACVIATLWLIQNSVAVVIWAMLISPMLEPINWISFSLSNGQKSLLFTSLKKLFFSVILAIFLWIITAFVVWIRFETTEILARTAPNILDLFIAIFSAVLAVLSLWFKRFWWESVAWVAMAASLMPPLEVTWIEIFLWNYALAYSSFMLFITNLIAIILIGIILFWIYGFTPHSWEKQKTSVESFILIFVFVLIISIPLVESLFIIKEKEDIKSQTKSYLENILKNENKNISVENIDVKQLSKENIILDSVIKIPENIDFYDTFKKQLDFELSKKLEKNVNLDIELIRIANITSKESVIDKDALIYEFITKEFDSNYKNFDLISLEIDKKEEKYYVKSIFWVKDDNYNVKIFDILKQKVTTNFNEKIEFTFVPVSLYKNQIPKSLDEFEKNKLDIENDLTSFIKSNIPNWINLKSIHIELLENNASKASLSFDIELNKNSDLIAFLGILKSYTDSKNIILEIKVFEFKEMKLYEEW